MLLYSGIYMCYKDRYISAYNSQSLVFVCALLIDLYACALLSRISSSIIVRVLSVLIISRSFASRWQHRIGR